MPEHERLNGEARRRLRRQTPLLLRPAVVKGLLVLAVLAWASAGLVLASPRLEGRASAALAVCACAGFLTKAALAQRRTRWLLAVLCGSYVLLAAGVAWQGSGLDRDAWAAAPLGMLAGVAAARAAYKRLLWRSVR